MNAPVYRAVRLGGQHATSIETLANGAQVLRALEPLQDHAARLTDRLVHWAAVAPERTLAAQRGSDGAWIHVSYAQMLDRARAIGQALVDRGLSAERPLMVLSDNDLEHLSLMLGAMWVGVPVVSLSAAYSLVSTDFGKLRHIAAQSTPGMVYAAHAGFGPAIEAVMPADVAVVLGQGALAHRASTPFAELLATVPSASGDAAHAATGPHTIAKLMFTSGSTKLPKGVIVTQRMWCANQQMIAQALPCLTDADTPPVLVDWLPWSHTFGGNHNLGIALHNGGSLYIDEGKPTPQGLAQTVRNLKSVSPTIYFNVPKGFDALCSAMNSDAELRQALFARVQLFEFGGAGLSQATLDALDAHAEAAVGERIQMISSLGMTETAPSCTYNLNRASPAGTIGLPLPGVDVKLVPTDGKTEIRFRGPNVMPGYWREPGLTAEAFDDEGYYCTGDAVRFIDPADPLQGLVYDGRLAEDFKLSSGTFVSVGPLRAKVLAHGFPLVQDSVIAGINRDEIAVMVFPRVDEARRLAGLADDVPAPEVLHHPAVRAFFQGLLNRLWAAGTGGANRPARLHVLAEPPSIDHGEVTDKGSINQRAVLTHRASVVEAMYLGSASDPCLFLPQRG
ncbi:MAG: hypothetical protein RJA98_2223 [Pseudomonadota bacterium]|jgi:feruloyl-CoA synthase